jgi:benzoyl-CoA reductase/2-hydroxyglutaryl-CoA dehydratase subunit BcrC/BadD/HgdB
MAIRDRISETHTAINQIRRVREQVEEWEKRASEHAAVKDAARTLKDALKAIEGQLINLDFENPRPGVNRVKEKWDALSSMIDESDDAPTQGATQVYEALNAALQEQRRALSEVMEGPVKSFSDLVRTEGIPPVGV